MLTPSRSRRVFAYQKPCDMRKQYDSLAALVSEAMFLDCLNGDLFLFVGRTRTRAKVLYFDGTGAYFAHREQPFRSIVNTCFAHRERSEATLAGRRVSSSW